MAITQKFANIKDYIKLINAGKGSIVTALGAITGTYSLIGFGMFILEESVQMAGFGVYTSIQTKNWAQARTALENMKEINKALKNYIDYIDVTFGVIADLSGLSDEEIKDLKPFIDEVSSQPAKIMLSPFLNFYLATQSSILAYETTISQHIVTEKEDFKKLIEIEEIRYDKEKILLRIEFDKKADELRIEKAIRQDELQLMKKKESDELINDAKAGIGKEITDEIQQVRRELDDELERVNRELADGVDRIEKELKEKGFSKDEITAAVRDFRQQKEDEKDKLRFAAEEFIQKIREEAAAATDKKGLTSREKAAVRRNIKKRYDELDIALRREFDEKERAMKENQAGAFLLLERIHRNKINEIKQIVFPTIKDKPIPAEDLLRAMPEFQEQREVLVTRVIDGDTFEAGEERIRIAGINAPELDAPGGIVARSYLSDLILNKKVTLQIDIRDRIDAHKRTIATVSVDGKNIAIEMLSSSNAVLFIIFDNKFIDKKAYEQAAERGRRVIPTPPTTEPIPPMPVPELPISHVTISFRFQYPDGSFSDKSMVAWDGKELQIPASRVLKVTWVSGLPMNIKATAEDGFLIKPDNKKSVEFSITPTTDEEHIFILTFAPGFEPPELKPLPADNFSLSGPGVTYRFGKMNGLVPFSATDAEKSGVSITETREIPISDYPDRHEMVRTHIRFSGGFSMSESERIVISWFRDSDKKKVFEFEHAIPPPSTQNADEWQYYEIYSWIGHADWEINGKGLYYVEFSSKTNKLVTGLTRLYFKVI